MANRMQKALAFVLSLSMCMSLLSIPALAEGEAPSSETPAAAQSGPQYPKEVDGAVYAPPKGSKNQGTAEDPTVDTQTASEGDTTTTKTTWAGSTAAENGAVTSVAGEDTAAETTVTRPDGSGTKTGTDTGSETITVKTAKDVEPAKTVEGKTVLPGEERPFSTDTGWQDTWAADDGEHLMGDKTDVSFGYQYDPLTVTAAPKGATERGDCSTATATQYATREAVEAWLRQNHPELLSDDPAAEVVVEPAYLLEWRQTGYTGYWGWVCDDNGDPIILKDAAGNPLIAGFYVRTSKTYEDYEENNYSSSYGETRAETHLTAKKAEPRTVTTVKVELPEGYVLGVTQETRGGRTTLTRVEAITDGDPASDTYGKDIGYRVTETVTDGSGKQLSSRSYSKYGTRVETETTITPTTDAATGVTATTVTTTTKYMYYTRRYVERGTKIDTARSAELQVGKVVWGNGHNRMQTGMLQPDKRLLNIDDPERHLVSGEGAWNNSTETSAPAGTFLYNGYGLRSSACVWTSKSPFGTATQFRITAANGQTIYAYCCDKDTHAKPGAAYDVANLEDAGYITDQDAIRHIEAIASNGFWGTSGTAGSLDAMRSLLVDAQASSEEIPDSVAELTATQLAALDEGLALTATQAALWKYGNQSKDLTIGTEEDGYPSVYQDEYDSEAGTWTTALDASTPKELTKDEKDVVKALYELLCSDYMVEKMQQPENASDVIQVDDIRSAALTVKERLADREDGTAVYNTALTFTLNVPADSSLTAQVMDVTDPENPVVLAQKRITGSGDALEKENGVLATDKDGNMTCTFQNLPLASGVKLRFVLLGTQALQPGVYLYQSIQGPTASQTFVGLTASEGTRSIDLQLDLSFTVTNAFMQDYEKRQAEYRTVTEGVKQTDITIDGAAEIATRITAADRVEKTWESRWQETFGPSHEPGGGGDEDVVVPPGGEADIPDDDVPTTDLPDEDTPTADVPRTGDPSLVWYALNLFSGIGLAGMTVYRKKHRDGESEN